MIEIKGFLETSFVDWPGKLCSVIFLANCNFRCPYCHNHVLIFSPENYPSIMLKEILQRLSSLRGWIDGVCITGGEPTLQFDLPNLVQEIKRHGFLIKLDTNGSHPEMLRELIQMKVIDFISMDVKAPLDPISYQRSVGIHFDINLILRSIEILKREEVEYQFRMTVVPQIHREEDIKLLGQQLKAGRRFVLQNFNPKDPLDPSLKNTPPFDPKRLREIEEEVQKMV